MTNSENEREEIMRLLVAAQEVVNLFNLGASGEAFHPYITDLDEAIKAIVPLTPEERLLGRRRIRRPALDTE